MEFATGAVKSQHSGDLVCFLSNRETILAPPIDDHEYIFRYFCLSLECYCRSIQTVLVAQGGKINNFAVLARSEFDTHRMETAICGNCRLIQFVGSRQLARRVGKRGIPQTLSQGGAEPGSGLNWSEADLRLSGMRSESQNIEAF